MEAIARQTFKKEKHPQAMSERSYHPSKIMLLVILNRLKDKAEELLAEKQAGVRPDRSTVEYIRQETRQEHSRIYL